MAAGSRLRGGRQRVFSICPSRWRSGKSGLGFDGRLRGWQDSQHRRTRKERENQQIFCVQAFSFRLHAPRMQNGCTRSCLKGCAMSSLETSIFLKRSAAGHMSHKRSGKMVCRMFPVCQAHASSSWSPLLRPLRPLRPHTAAPF
jgi:hypothetical protein